MKLSKEGIQGLIEQAKLSHGYSALGNKGLMPFVERLEELLALREETRWISVTERLPEESGYYDTYFKYGSDKNSLSRVSTDWFDKGLQMFCANPEATTHWKPLPKKPTEE